MEEVLHRHVAEGTMPGSVALVDVGDGPDVVAVGTLAFDSAAPMACDSVFRIASITKAVTAVAALSLVDDGSLAMGDRVDRWLPELAEPVVLRTLASDLDDTVPADRPITVEDLLTYRLGFGSIMAPPGSYPIQAEAEDVHELKTLTLPWPPTPHGPDEWMKRFGSLPLLSQPGTQWHYNTSAQVLGVLLARALDTTLPALFDERVLGPLAMVDTGFWLQPAQHERLTTAYLDDEAREVVAFDEPGDSYWHGPPAFPDASSGLLSTADDLWRLAAMLRAGGALDGTRVLRAETVRALTTDHLTAAQRDDNALFLGDRSGWGLGILVPAAGHRPTPAGEAFDRPGGYGWDGGTGTSWRTDPEVGLTGILLTQRAMGSPELPEVFRDFWQAAYGSARRS